MTLPRGAARAVLSLTVAVFGLTVAAAPDPLALKRVKFELRPEGVDLARNPNLIVDAVEFFVTPEDLEGTQFVRARFRARVGSAWQELDTELTALEFTTSRRVNDVHAVIARQARQFAETTGSRPPPLETEALPSNAIVGATWANNFEEAMRSLLTDVPVPWFNSEIAVVLARGAIRSRAFESFPARVRVRHLTWMPPIGDDLVSLETDVRGTFERVPVSREEIFELALRSTSCDGVLAH